MASTSKEWVTFARSLELHQRPDAHLLLTRPSRDFDVEVLRFNSRASLEGFNVKAKLRAVILTQVPSGCAIYPHQSDSVARARDAIEFPGLSADDIYRIRLQRELSGKAG